MDKAAAAQRANLTDPATWVDRYANDLYQYALFRVQQPTVAEDLVQETFLAAFRSRKSFQGLSSEKTWLIGILKNKVIDYFRKRDREIPTEHIEHTADTLADQFDEKGHWKVGPAKWSVNPGKVYEQQEFMTVMQKCLSDMPERLSRVFVLREMEDFDTDQICKDMGISASNTWVMLHRARASLRNCLEVNWFT